MSLVYKQKEGSLKLLNERIFSYICLLHFSMRIVTRRREGKNKTILKKGGMFIMSEVKNDQIRNNVCENYKKVALKWFQIRLLCTKLLYTRSRPKHFH